MALEIPIAIICFFVGAAIEYRVQFFQHILNLAKRYERPPKIIHDVEIIKP